MRNQYCPNVDRLVSCILLNLIELTPMRFGIDFNLLWQTKATYLRAREPERVVARLFEKTWCAPPNCGSNTYTFYIGKSRPIFGKALAFRTLRTCIGPKSN